MGAMIERFMSGHVRLTITSVVILSAKLWENCTNFEAEDSSSLLKSEIRNCGLEQFDECGGEGEVDGE